MCFQFCFHATLTALLDCKLKLALMNSVYDTYQLLNVFHQL